jgi:hypothetical protein
MIMAGSRRRGKLGNPDHKIIPIIDEGVIFNRLSR